MANTLRFKRGLVSGIPTAALGEPLFTTDTFDLYIGNGTTNTRFQKYIASGATTQILRGDGSLYTFPLAISSPSAGQVLKYNGTSWVNDSDAGITGSGTTNYLPKFTGATTLGNSLVFDNGTSVGIGTATPVSYSSPAQVLNIVSAFTNAEIKLTNSTTGNTSTAGLLIAQYGVDTYLWNGSAGLLAFGTSNTQRARITAGGNFIINNASTDNGLRFQVTGDGYFSGSVGIGTTPSAKLHVIADTLQSIFEGGTQGSIRIKKAGVNGVQLYSNAAGQLQFYNDNTSATSLTLDNTGNLGLGVVPSAWDAGIKAFEIFSSGNGIVSSTSSQNILSTNAKYVGGGWKYGSNGLASTYQQQSGVHTWNIAPSGSANATITFTQAMTLDASGRLGIGTTNPDSKLHVLTSGPTNQFRINYNGTNDNYYDALNHYFRSGDGSQSRLFLFSTGNVAIANGVDAGYKLDVNGTMRVSGASTFNGKMLLSTSLNYGLEVYNNTSADSRLNLTNSTTGTGINKGTMVGAISTTAYLYNYQNGSLILGTNGTDRLTIDSTGAATFSSSVTVASLVVDTTTLVVDATNNYVGIGTATPKRHLDVSTTGSPEIVLGALSGATDQKYWRVYSASDIMRLGYVNDAFTSGTDVVRMNRSGQFGIGMNPSYTLDVTGEARVSNAIAIGTTPDTNKPFKILKNINGTVGINFENTSTGASAFSAIQMGTDVSGGTAFANLVYSSSGVTAAGVYQPSGTSLINTGSGGLNFLSVSQPIRFFTSTGNGTERLRITNDGDITHYNGTSPSASTTDAYRMYSADVVAGNAAPHFRTENGAVIKLYQETTGVGNAIFSQGGGNSVLDDSTFDGYTLRQIVKALRNQGILA